MSKYICIGTDGKNLLFYNEAKGEFYSAKEGYFNIELDDDFSFLEEFPSSDQEAREQVVLITNPDEIKALKSAYKSIKNLKNKEKKLAASIKTLHAKEKEARQADERRRKICLVYSFISLTLAIFNSEIHTMLNHLGDNLEEVIDDYHANFQNDEKHLKAFCSSISENSTMNEEVREILNSLFRTLVESDAYISDYKVRDICQRLKKFNFENYDESNYLDAMPYIIFGCNNGFNKLISASLNECANNLEPSEESRMFGLLNMRGNSETLTQIFIGGEEYYIQELAKCYNASKEDIKALLNLIILYGELEDKNERAEIKTEYYQKLGSMFLDYYRNQNTYSDIDYLTLSSQVFHGNFTINNNIFANQIVINVDDPKYGEYSLYYDAKTGKDISYLIYYEKLVNLINNKGNSLDYSDPDSRFLIYLTYLAYEDAWGFEHYEFGDLESSEDLAWKFINNIFYGNYGRVDVNPAFLYAYLSNGQINLTDVIENLHTPDTDAFSIALFKEFDSCIRIDINKSNTPYDDYNEVLAKKLDTLKKNDENLYNLLMNSIVDDTSFFKEFNLSPFSYTLQNGDIKKYVYTPEE